MAKKDACNSFLRHNGPVQSDAHNSSRTLINYKWRYQSPFDSLSAVFQPCNRIHFPLAHMPLFPSKVRFNPSGVETVPESELMGLRS